MHMPDLRIATREAVGLLALAVILTFVQGTVFWKYFHRASSETDKQNLVISSPPDILPGLGALAILCGDAGLLILQNKPLRESIKHESLT